MSAIKNAPAKTLNNNKRPFIVVSVIAILISFIYSFKLKWLGDDIFIGFRYVQNFLDGNGLVYNVGERVEGYTDFLWIILISFFSWFNVDPVLTVQALGILSSIGTLILFSIITYKLTYPHKYFILPFIPLALALNHDFNVWATSGLETSFYCFLLCAAFYTYFFSAINENKKYFITGLFLCLSMLTRPDAAIIVALADFLLLFQLLRSRIKLTKIFSVLFIFNLALIIIYIPYFIWRYNYYGFIFPNTYYFKLGYESMFKQGFYYIWIYFVIHFVSFLIFALPPIILFGLGRKTKILNVSSEFKRSDSAFFISILIVFVYLFGFVAKVGGDFMFARFIIPVVPFIYFIIYYSILKIVNEKKLNLTLIILLCLSFIETNIRFQIFRSFDETVDPGITLNRGIADERDVYVNYAPIEIETKLGKAIHRSFNGIDAKLLIAGGQACFGYYADFNYCQEMHGLTDTLIAHSEVKNRGRIGHEKAGTLEYFENKGIDLLFNRPLPSNDQFRYARFILPPFDIDIAIVTYKTETMSALKERFGSEIQFIDFPVYLDEYIKNKLPVISKENLQEDYKNFNLYYFKHNKDSLREKQFLNLIGKI